MNRSIVLLFLILVLASFQKNEKLSERIIFLHYHPEIIRGDIKQIIWIRKMSYVRKDNFAFYPYDTVNFNKKNEVLNISSGDNHRDSDVTKYLYTYNRSLGYNVSAKSKYSNDIYKYKNNGDVEQFSYYQDKKLKYLMHHIVFKGNGLRIDEMIEYNRADSVMYQRSFGYDKNNQLTQEYSIPENKKLDIKIVYDNIILDNQGNWVKRIKRTELNRKLINVDTVTRKITYY